MRCGPRRRPTAWLEIDGLCRVTWKTSKARIMNWYFVLLAVRINGLLQRRRMMRKVQGWGRIWGLWMDDPPVPRLAEDCKGVRRETPKGLNPEGVIEIKMGGTWEVPWRWLLPNCQCFRELNVNEKWEKVVVRCGLGLLLTFESSWFQGCLVVWTRLPRVKKKWVLKKCKEGEITWAELWLKREVKQFKGNSPCPYPGRGRMIPFRAKRQQL